jgi:primosomal protein N' (replication factor Y)
MERRNLTMSAFARITPLPRIPAVDALTYRVPSSLEGVVTPGKRVVVPLGTRRVTGLVTSIDDAAPAGVDCREIDDVLDSEPLFTDELLKLLDWMAGYYGSSFAEVASLAIGRGLTASSRRTVELIDASAATTDAEREIVTMLEAAGGKLDVRRLRKQLGDRSPESRLTALARKEAIRVEQQLTQPAVRARSRTWVEINGTLNGEDLDAALGRAPKRRAIYDYLLERPGRRASTEELTELFSTPGPQIAALEQAGLVRRSEREFYREIDVAAEQTDEPVLSPDQAAAVEQIEGSLGKYEPVLLQGVTSSGKTEVYLQLIRRVLDSGSTALLLVPEISLTHQTVGRLVGRFGPTVAVLHSELSAGERWDQWRRICRQEARIAVGARSAVLAPLRGLGLIIVDEEHDAAFKQEDGVRYNGRDVAVVRAREAGCPIVLGSATPSIESRKAADDGRYTRIVLPTRVTGSPLPSVECVDLRGRDVIATGGLSDHLAALTRGNFEAGGQTLLFLNRRGFAACMQCWSCGEMVECSACSVGMTFHRSDGRLRCHHCDSSRPTPPRCPTCDADALSAQGLGTQKLEEAVRRLIPDARVERLDRDAAERKGTSREILQRWRAGQVDVLIGTQMITKGHDAPGVTLVGVIQADLALGVPDFRAAERTFQLLTQVAGRAGRSERRGKVVFQTYRPDHFAIAAAVRHDYETFATTEFEERKELGYPPFSRMALLRVEGADRAAAESMAGRAAEALMRLSSEIQSKGDAEGLTVRGPAPAAIERIKDRYRFIVQVRSASGAVTRHAVLECRRLLEASARAARIRLLVDIDPVDMM